MMNSLQNTAKFLRYINIKSIFQAPKTCAPTVVASMKVPAVQAAVFSPRSIGVDIGEMTKIIGRIQQEPMKYVPIVNPRSILPLLENEWQRQEVGLPSQKNEEIQAARLIVIRKRKMKKHQRRKLWKKMRHRWARVKQRRRITKEKIFQSELLSMIKAANDFSAEDYVRSKIEQANHRPLPTRWRHKRLPEFIIRQLLGIDKKINYKHTDTYKA